MIGKGSEPAMRPKGALKARAFQEYLSDKKKQSFFTLLCLRVSQQNLRDFWNGTFLN